MNVNEITTCVYEIVGSSNSKMNDTKMLDKDSRSKNMSWQLAKYPLLDNDHGLTKALIAIALGCDVFDRIIGIGPSRIYSLICDV